MQQEAERDVIRTKFLAQLCTSMMNPDNTGAINGITSMWKKYIALSYGVGTDELDEQATLTEEVMAKEYAGIKDLKLSLRKTKEGGVEVIGMPGEKAPNVKQAKI